MPRGGAGDGFHRRSRMRMKLLEFAEWGKENPRADFCEPSPS
jgi:hypothetical protein